MAQKIAQVLPLSIVAADITSKAILNQARKLDQCIIKYEAAEEIARSIVDLKNKFVLEVNPGFGVLTRALLNAGATRIFALEPRPIFSKPLEELSKESGDRLNIIKADFKLIDRSRPGSISSADILGRVERRLWEDEVSGYITGVSSYLSTKQLLSYLMDQRATYRPLYHCWGRVAMAMIFPDTQSKSILASPGSKRYGRLSLFAQMMCDVIPSVKVPVEHIYPDCQELNRRTLSTNGSASAYPRYFQLIRLIPKREIVITEKGTAIADELIQQIMTVRNKPIVSILTLFLPDAIGFLEEIGVPADTTGSNLTAHDAAKIINRVAIGRQDANGSSRSSDS
ncbi:hypothetical protein EMCRGX_G032069 [Ephydatia muelleri]